MATAEPYPGVIPSSEAEEASAVLASIVESSADAIFTLDRGGKIVTWNHSAVRVFGYAASEAVGRSAEFLFPDDLGNRPDVLWYRSDSGLTAHK